MQVFNIHSSADGVDFWGTNRASVNGELADDAFAPPCVGDGMLEVVGTRGVSDLVAARGGFSHSRRLAQGRRVEVRTSAPVAAQMDGETWVLSPSSVVITHAGSIPLCVGPGRPGTCGPGWRRRAGKEGVPDGTVKRFDYRTLGCAFITTLIHSRRDTPCTDSAEAVLAD